MAVEFNEDITEFYVPREFDFPMDEFTPSKVKGVKAKEKSAMAKYRKMALVLAAAGTSLLSALALGGK